MSLGACAFSGANRAGSPEPDAGQHAPIRTLAVQLFETPIRQHQWSLGNDSGVSLACPISPDGVFLATTHGISREADTGIGYIILWKRADPSEPVLIRRVEKPGIIRLVNGSTLGPAQVLAKRVERLRHLPPADLSLVRTKVAPRAFYTLSPKPPRRGQRVYLFRNPWVHDSLGESPYETRVNAVYVRKDGSWMGLTDVPTRKGDSGAAVVSDNGFLIGLVTEGIPKKGESPDEIVKADTAKFEGLSAAALRRFLSPPSTENRATLGYPHINA
ncbi:MAG: serine protease, partial [Verrucomicrobiota bacterium]|nr:serine protease [Verrucomicrobiota bacterium]